MGQYPVVSVIVPAARAEQAAHTLESLSCQRYPGKIEIIVVSPAADALARRWPIIPVKPVTMGYPGAARNLGATHATGEVLLFLDDDCTAADDWVERNVQALAQPGTGAVGGRIRGKSRAFFARCTDFVNFGDFQHKRAIEILLAAASLGVRRTVFDAAGGFEETKPYGEDIEFSHRVQHLGYHTIYQPDICVLHDHRRDTLGKILQYNYRNGYITGLAAKLRHKQSGLRNRLLYMVRSPFVFLLCLPAIAAAATARIVLMNVRDNREVLLYAPFILLAKLAYELGIFRNLMLTMAPPQDTRA